MAAIQDTELTTLRIPVRLCWASQFCAGKLQDMLDADGWHLVNLPEGTFTENLLELVLCIDLEPETRELKPSELNNPSFKQGD